MVSMSDMKCDAIVKSGIEIYKRYDSPGEYLGMRLVLNAIRYSSYALMDLRRLSYSTQLACGDRCEDCCWVFLEW